MRNSALSLQLRRLRQLIDRTGTATEDIELQSHWGRYLCVVTSGFVESGLHVIYSEFAERSANDDVARFVSGRLKRVQNPNAERFVQVAGSFKARWRDELEDFLIADAGSRKEALDSIMNNRNQIAHGKTVGITVHRVREYLDRCVEVLEFIEDQCEGQ